MKCAPVLLVLQAMTLAPLPSSAFLANRGRASQYAPQTRIISRKARPDGVSGEDWQVVVDAEKASRERKYGPLAGVLIGKAEIEQNQLRIWEALSEKRDAAAAAGTRESRRNAKKLNKGSSKRAKQASSVPATMPLGKQVPAASVDSAPASPSFGLGLVDGLLNKAAAAFPEADALARVSAEGLNAKLEDAGVLEKLERGAPPSASSADAPKAEGPSPEMATAVSKSQLKKQKKAQSKRKKK